MSRSRNQKPHIGKCGSTRCPICLPHKFGSSPHQHALKPSERRAIQDPIDPHEGTIFEPGHETSECDVCDDMICSCFDGVAYECELGEMAARCFGEGAGYPQYIHIGSPLRSLFAELGETEALDAMTREKLSHGE